MKRLWLWSYKPPVDCCWRIPARCNPVTGPGPLINIPGPIVWTYWKPLEDPLRSSPGPFHWLGPPPLLNWLLTDSCSSGRIIDWYQFSHIKMGSYRLKTAGPKPIQSKKKTKRKFPTGGKGQHFCAPEGEAGGQRRGGGFARQLFWAQWKMIISIVSWRVVGVEGTLYQGLKAIG